MIVILSVAKNLDDTYLDTLLDSSSRSAPQNDIFADFFSSLLERWWLEVAAT